MITYGRKRIYCEEQEITRENLIKVLRKAYSDHREIRNQIQFLIDYEGGIQPLPRPKEIRPEIDIKVADGAPTYIKEFKQSYFWGTPALLVQRSENENHSDSAAAEDSGINALNEMMRYGNNLPYSNQQLSEFVENTGIGHTIIIPKNHDEIRYENGIPVSVFERSALDSRFAFVVYHEGAILREALGVTFFKSRSGKLKFTCYTDKYVWRVENWKIVEEDDPLKNINVLGMIPIVEFERSVDRTGAWEHQISSIDNLNVQISDFANDVSQATQQIWWGDNVNLDDDENGDPKTPKSGEWILTYSTGDRKAAIQSLDSNLDRASTLNSISYTWNRILQKCHVPITQDSSGGGSTGSAISMSTGWNDAELDATREESVIERGLRKELALMLQCIELAPFSVIPADDAVRTVHSGDIVFKWRHKNNYDLTVKSNFISTLVAKGFNGRHVIKAADAFEDVEAVWNDSREMVEAIQRSQIADDSEDTVTLTSGDPAAQVTQSPIIDGMNTDYVPTVV